MSGIDVNGDKMLQRMLLTGNGKNVCWRSSKNSPCLLALAAEFIRLSR